MRRASAVLAGLAIGIAASLIPVEPTAVGPREALPSKSPAPATAIAPVACDQKIAVTLPISALDATSSSWSPDGERLAVGAHAYYRMGSPTPDQQRVLLLTVATLSLRDIARGTDPVWSADGSRLAFRDGHAWTDPAADLVVYDVASSIEVDRIASVSTKLPFGWRGTELLYWKGSELWTWQGGPASRILDVGRAPEPGVVTARFSGDGERAVITVGAWDRAPSEASIVDTRAGSVERLIGAWRVEPSPRGHDVFASFLDHRELRLEDGSIRSAPIPFTGGIVLWSSDGRQPLLSPNEFVGFESTADLETFDGSAAGVAVPTLLQSAAFNLGGDLFSGVRYGGRGPSSVDLYRCRMVEARPNPSTVTVYYGESSFEPWAAKRDGTAPAGWEALAERDLKLVGLHPLEIGRIRTLEPSILCDQPKCPNGFGLRVVIPYADRDRAYSRCFREPYPNTFAMDAAIGAYQCVPLYSGN
jgi:WD40 repeat protein